MNFKEYKPLAARTCPTLGEGGISDNIHMMLGMITEIEELYNAVDSINAMEEIGDFFWYFANECRLSKYTFGEKLIDFPMDTQNFNEVDLFCRVAQMADFYKKAFAYGKKLDFQAMDAMAWHIGTAICCAGARVNKMIAKQHGEDKVFTLSQVLEANINKLRLRFPEKFEADKAINRDHDAERIGLEKNLNVN